VDIGLLSCSNTISNLDVYRIFLKGNTGLSVGIIAVLAVRK
jgi:hypothetical protein